jgi:hypothetical protein
VSTWALGWILGVLCVFFFPVFPTTSLKAKRRD